LRRLRHGLGWRWQRLRILGLEQLGPYWTFLAPHARLLNRARLQHLSNLALPVEGKRVLEVGAGIGMLTAYFLGRDCEVITTEARPENVLELRRRHPGIRAELLDLEHPPGEHGLGHFDIAFCYGTLYHLADPDTALRWLSRVSDMILLETCVTPGPGEFLHLVSEDSAVLNQSASGTGCRPTRGWVLAKLTEHWGFGAATRTQPRHRDFPLEWNLLSNTPDPVRNTRAVFVGSRWPLANPLLTGEAPSTQYHH
jgi:SAM-dependent methyltransferase